MHIRTLVSVAALLIAGFMIRSDAQTSTQGSLPHAWNAAQEQPYTLAAGPNGRYQIIAATLETGVPPTVRTVIRIDSQTGKAWRLVDLGDPSGITKLSWMPIAESTLEGAQ